VNRRAAIYAFAAFAALGAAGAIACGRGGPAAGSVTPLKPAGGPARDTAPIAPALHLPTAAAPRADGKLKLIWFRDFE
jgi:hypothetical protein